MKLLISTLFSLLLTSLAGASYSQVPQIERDALIALYNSTDGSLFTEPISPRGFGNKNGLSIVQMFVVFFLVFQVSR